LERLALLASALTVACAATNPAGGPSPDGGPREAQAPEHFARSFLGRQLPDFTLEEGGRWFNADDGLSLADLRGRSALIVYTTPC